MRNMRGVFGNRKWVMEMSKIVDFFLYDGGGFAQLPSFFLIVPATNG